MRYSERQLARERAAFLLERTPGFQMEEQPEPEVAVLEDINLEAGENSLREKLMYAGVDITPSLVTFVSAGLGLLFALVALRIMPVFLVPFAFIAGAWLPFSWLERKIDARAAAFAEDYPTVLLATASSIKTGLTPYLALERSTKLLPKDSLMRAEVEKLASQLREGVAKERALNEFGSDIRLNELELFRRAFLLVLENGGRFAPTLHRLARVSKDREELISNARVSTATMRMTANVLIMVAPLILFTVSMRSDNFFELLLTHPTANLVASIGLVTIAGSYAILKRMSNFKP